MSRRSESANRPRFFGGGSVVFVVVDDDDDDFESGVLVVGGCDAACGRLRRRFVFALLPFALLLLVRFNGTEVFLVECGKWLRCLVVVVAVVVVVMW